MNSRALLLAFRKALCDPAFRAEVISDLVKAYSDQLAVEPVFDSDAAKRLIPMTDHQLDYWLYKAPTRPRIPARYRVIREGTRKRKVRVFYASEIQLLRRCVLTGDLSRAIIAGSFGRVKELRSGAYEHKAYDESQAEA